MTPFIRPCSLHSTVVLPHLRIQAMLPGRGCHEALYWSWKSPLCTKSKVRTLCSWPDGPLYYSRGAPLQQSQGVSHQTGSP